MPTISSVPPVPPIVSSVYPAHPTLGRLSIAFFIDSVPFTPRVIRGETSLGGSESACLAVARGLAARGHDVHIFATKLQDGAAGVYGDVEWHPDTDLPTAMMFADFDVFCSLRMTSPFAAMKVTAKMNVYWAQDLLIHPMQVDAVLGQVDEIFYVSDYHRLQWTSTSKVVERSGSWVTRNPIDLDLARSIRGQAAKHPHRCIYISRPERAMDGLLKVWPLIRSKLPTAELMIARYDSMYDAQGWGKICESYDEQMSRVNDEVGGITFLGTMNKETLYWEIARSAVMLYPTSLPNFAETNCIAATEAQACGTLFIGSHLGALPETVGKGAGILLHHKAVEWEKQDENSKEYGGIAETFADVVVTILTDGYGWGVEGRNYKDAVEKGYKHVEPTHYEDVAAEWEEHISKFFLDRYQQNRVRVLRQLLHWDNHKAGMECAKDIIETGQPIDDTPRGHPGYTSERDVQEAVAAYELCDRVVRQEEQTAEHYAQYAIQDPEQEAQGNGRFTSAIDALIRRLCAHCGVTPEQLAQRPSGLHILDFACGNGSFAIALAKVLPNVTIDAYDYSPGVLEIARAAMVKLGLESRIVFHQVRGDWADVHFEGITFDAAFCGEFMEHVEDPSVLIAKLNSAVNGPVVLTVPKGPFAELLSRGTPRQRGHIHSFTSRDLGHLFAGTLDFDCEFLPIGDTPRGNPVGYWRLAFTGTGKQPDGFPICRPLTPDLYWHTILTERPYQTLHAMMIVLDGEEWLSKCLNSIYHVVDKIYVTVDDRTSDFTRVILNTFDPAGGKIVWREYTWPDSFSIARNDVLDWVREEGADWAMWIDADEHLKPGDGHKLHRNLLPASPFMGMSVRQQHLEVDGVNFFDTPVRLFRIDTGIRFFGIIHEQPETEMDEGIFPALTLDVDFVHLGYIEEKGRRYKSAVRNLPLLRKALKENPREVDYYFAMRDYVTLAKWTSGPKGELTHVGIDQLQRAVKTYYRSDPGFWDIHHKIHREAWGVLQEAMEMLSRAGIENYLHVEWMFRAEWGGLKGKSSGGVKFWARTAEEAHGYISDMVEKWLGEGEAPTIRVHSADHRPLPYLQIGSHAFLEPQTPVETPIVERMDSLLNRNT